jgi:hypothetical protein
LGRARWACTVSIGELMHGVPELFPKHVLTSRTLLARSRLMVWYFGTFTQTAMITALVTPVLEGGMGLTQLEAIQRTQEFFGYLQVSSLQAAMCFSQGAVADVRELCYRSHGWWLPPSSSSALCGWCYWRHGS